MSHRNVFLDNADKTPLAHISDKTPIAKDKTPTRSEITIAGNKTPTASKEAKLTCCKNRVELDTFEFLDHYVDPTSNLKITYQLKLDPPNESTLPIEMPGFCKVTFSPNKNQVIFKAVQGSLGEGVSGQVYRFDDVTKINSPIAIKYVFKPNETEVTNEAQINKVYKGIGGYIFTETSATILMLHERGTDLRQFKIESWDNYFPFSINFSLNVAHLHRFAAHRDLNLRNVIVDNLNPKLVDFGLARFLDSQPITTSDKSRNGDKSTVQHYFRIFMPNDSKDTATEIRIFANEIIDNILHVPLSVTIEDLKLLEEFYKNLATPNYFSINANRFFSRTKKDNALVEHLSSAVARPENSKTVTASNN